MTYNEFIQNIIDTRGQWVEPEDGIWQNHHIIPLCMGGEPENYNHFTKHPNMIWLTPEEHYDAHRLLFEENPTNYSLGLAWANFHTFNNTEISRDKYASLWRTFITLQSERLKGTENGYLSFAGMHHSDESKLKISKSNKGKKHNIVITDELRVAYGDSTRGTCWYNNGINEIRYIEGEQPDDYVKGVIHSTSSTQGMHWYNNGEINIVSYQCPPGFKDGKIQKRGYKCEHPKHKWLTPNGDIKEMDKTNAKRFHKDWILLD